VPYPEDYNSTYAAEAAAVLRLDCRDAATNAAVALSANAGGGQAVLTLGGFSSAGSSPYTSSFGRAAVPEGLCYWPPGNHSSKALGGRCAVPGVQYLGFDAAWWRNASVGFCPCHAQKVGLSGLELWRMGAADWVGS